eukprot:3679870-Rhodomonas_salina.2
MGGLERGSRFQHVLLHLGVFSNVPVQFQRFDLRIQKKERSLEGVVRGLKPRDAVRGQHKICGEASEKGGREA